MSGDNDANLIDRAISRVSICSDADNDDIGLLSCVENHLKPVDAG